METIKIKKIILKWVMCLIVAFVIYILYTSLLNCRCPIEFKQNELLVSNGNVIKTKWIEYHPGSRNSSFDYIIQLDNELYFYVGPNLRKTGFDIESFEDNIENQRYTIQYSENITRTYRTESKTSITAYCVVSISNDTDDYITQEMFFEIMYKARRIYMVGYYSVVFLLFFPVFLETCIELSFYIESIKKGKKRRKKSRKAKIRGRFETTEKEGQK